MVKINKSKIKNRFYTSHYFKITHKILKKHNNSHLSTLQFKTFYKHEYLACGALECIETLKVGLSTKQFKSLKIYYLPDGVVCQPNTPILSITGKYSILCEFENILDSILARRSSIATNCYHILKYITPDQVVFMSDRSDDYRMHPYDGYAAWVAGIYKFSNQSHLEFIKDKKCKVFGSMPHALIHQYQNNLSKLLDDYLLYEPNNACLLVDFDNDIIQTLANTQQYFNRLSAIRIDTATDTIDQAVLEDNECGITHNLVVKIRNYLDHNNGQHIKIVASSGNDLDKIKYYHQHKTPIDFYGIGSYLTHLSLHFTADLVEIDNVKYAKNGREYLLINDLTLYK